MADLNLKVPALEKLIDYGASGVGAIPGPMLAPWRAYWEGKAKRISARADADVRRLQAESESETSAIIAKARADARESLGSPDAVVHGTAEFTHGDIIQRIEFQERKRLDNIKSIVEGAADELGDKEVDDHEPDPDWTARFFNEAQDVSSEDMQKIWAKILAGEVESLGRTSLRTLDTLTNMTKKDAEMFTDICGFVVDGEWIFYGDSLVKNISALAYSNLLHLQDCGLLIVQSFLSRQIKWHETKESLLSYGTEVLMIN